MTEPARSFSYPVVQRLRLIDLLLDTYGLVNRAALCHYFGISVPQASRDIQDYLSLAPDNARYDAHAKAYVKREPFKKVWP